jgi:hypothetical protein
MEDEEDEEEGNGDCAPFPGPPKPAKPPTAAGVGAVDTKGVVAAPVFAAEPAGANKDWLAVADAAPAREELLNDPAGALNKGLAGAPSADPVVAATGAATPPHVGADATPAAPNTDAVATPLSPALNNDGTALLGEGALALAVVTVGDSPLA